MTFKVKSSPEGSAFVEFTDEPSYCHALQSAPSVREPMLDRGNWLVLVFARWSQHDVNAIQVALDAVRQYRGAVQLGVRPYDDPREGLAWLPVLAEAGGTPTWLLMKRGELRSRRVGALSREALIDEINSHLVES